MAKKMLFLFVLLLSLTGMLKAQVTTAGMSGKVMADEESVIGATVVAPYTNLPEPVTVLLPM